MVGGCKTSAVSSTHAPNSTLQARARIAQGRRRDPVQRRMVRRAVVEPGIVAAHSGSIDEAAHDIRIVVSTLT